MKQIFTLLAFLLCGVLGYSQPMTVTIGSTNWVVNDNTAIDMGSGVDYAGATSLTVTLTVSGGDYSNPPKFTLFNGTPAEAQDVSGTVKGGGLVYEATVTIATDLSGDIQVDIGGFFSVRYDENANDMLDGSDRQVYTSNVLPVEISSFTGRYSPKGMAVLNWTTESELNNDFFTVERSFDGRDFEAVEKIAGAGTSLESQTYQFLDHTAVSLAKSNTVYYRLKQTDFDGAFSHSDLISVELDRKDVLEVNSFVNESTGIDLYYSVPQNSKVVVSIFTTSGQQIKKETYNVEAGNNLYQADISNLPSGMYILSLQNGESILNQKFVK